MTRFAGIDVGGTKSAAVLLDEAGAIVARAWTEHDGRDAGRLIDIVLDSFARLLSQPGVTRGRRGSRGSRAARDAVAGLGVAVSGLVSSDRSTVVRAPTLGERNLDLGRSLATQLGTTVVVCNDANATLYGQARRPGAGRRVAGPTETTLLLTLGTGLGGAVLVGDRIFGGEHGFAAELGHIAVDFADERICACGSRGCVEQFASGRGLEELAAADATPAASCETLARLGAAPPWSTRDIVAAAAAGDAWAIELLRRSGAMLGRAIVMLAVVLDPGNVIIGGSFGHATAEWLLPSAEAELRERWPFATERPIPRLTLDDLGPWAAATGAALLAADECAREAG